MIRIRRAADRGHAEHGWLQSAHTFSFAGYHDPAHMGFRALRVINEDTVAPGRGFPPHGHRDMEIVTYVLEGALEHEDFSPPRGPAPPPARPAKPDRAPASSTGHRSVIRPGDVQRMSAGTGVYHSEYNASQAERVRFLQIWILPERRGLPPSYEERRFDEAERRGALRVLCSPDGADGSLRLNQDARIFGALLRPGDEVRHAIAPARHAWIQIARGEVTANGERLSQGDGAAVSDEREIALWAGEDAELLLFDLG